MVSSEYRTWHIRKVKAPAATVAIRDAQRRGVKEVRRRERGSQQYPGFVRWSTKWHPRSQSSAKERHFTLFRVDGRGREIRPRRSSGECGFQPSETVQRLADRRAANPKQTEHQNRRGRSSTTDPAFYFWGRIRGSDRRAMRQIMFVDPVAKIFAQGPWRRRLLELSSLKICPPRRPDNARRWKYRQRDHHGRGRGRQSRRPFAARHWAPGGGRRRRFNCHGRSGEDLIIQVPPDTIVLDADSSLILTSQRGRVATSSSNLPG